VIAVTEFGLIPEGFSMGPNRRRGRGAAAASATPNRSPTGTGSSEKNVNGNEGKHRQIPNVMNEDSGESRMWFREDRSARAIRRSLDAAEIQAA
jgi:hypothetical protein